MAAGGHFGNKSHELVKHYATDLGFKYLSASTKEEFQAVLDEFASPNVGNQSMILEVFTNHEDEEKAREAMCNILHDSLGDILNGEAPVGEKAKNILRSALGENGIKTAKKLFGKG
jgi:2-succinyl-5-enolpyruvyl-6-hydroxy-3-cyclohexene-1-carboxylate synthase